jgi:hypothetical protein
MNITSHESVLAALKNRASRYSNRGFTCGADNNLVSWALDKTGTVDASFLCNNNENNKRIALVEQQERNRVAELGVPEEVLRIHGVAPGSKRDGVIRLIYENVNGINNRLCNNDKVEKAKEIIDDLEADIVAYNEHRLNMQDRHNVNGFSQLFKGGEAAIHSVVAHNVHENFGKVQEGGTSLMAIKPLTEFIEHDQAGKDETGLGRWSIMTFKGDQGKTRVICGYNPCCNSNPDSSTSYQQHRRFFVTRKKDLTCPRMKFWDDLVVKLQRWREDGNQLVVCLDANKNIYKKSLGKSLTDIDGLAMKEVVGEFIQITVGATYFWGSKPIDGIWATLDITVCNACIMPAGYGIGDHRLFVIDFASWDIVGDMAPKVAQPASRRLNTKIPRAMAEYARLLEEKIIQHQLIERIGKTNSKCRYKSSLTWHLNKMDKELGQYIRFAEKKCCKFKSGHIPFSPESSLWICQMQVYRSLLKYHAGHVQNRGNLNQLAHWCNIPDAFSITIQEVYFRLTACQNMCNYFWKHGHYYRRKHLYSRLDIAKEKEDEEAARQILDIIQQKKINNSGGECLMLWGGNKAEHVSGFRLSKGTGQRRNKLAKRSCRRRSGITSTGRDFT